MSQHISIKEFAKRAGITPQAVYKQLDNKLQPFVKLINGKKAIQIEALSLFNNNNLNSVGCSTTTNQLNGESSLILKILQDQLEAKDRQLEAKDKQLAEKDEQIKALNEALMKAQQLTDQAQHLQANTEKRLLAIEAPKKHKWQFWKKSEDIEE